MIIKIIFKPAEDSTIIELGNLQLFLLMRVIDEIDYFFDSISKSQKDFIENLKADSPEMRGYYRVKEQQKKDKTA